MGDEERCKEIEYRDELHDEFLFACNAKKTLFFLRRL